MALSANRVPFRGTTPYPHEEEGIRFALGAIPDTDPYHAWALIDLLDPSTGRLLEIDLLVLGYSCLYLVEMKAWPGRITGDSVDWQWLQPEGRTVWRDNPRPLANRKAQILKSRLERAIPRDVRVPWIESLVFLTDKDVRMDLAPEGAIGVIKRDGFLPAIMHHKFRGADPRHQGNALSTSQVRAVVQAMRAIGVRERKGKLHVGSYALGELLAETETYQDRDATHRDIPAQKRRARTYLVPTQTSVELRQQLRRAADREAQLLYSVREHPNVLRYMDYVTDAEVGPTILFDAFTDAMPLDAFLRQHPDLAFPARLSILTQVARALDHGHRRGVMHGAVSPSSILVRGVPEPEVRLFNFQLGRGEEVDPTSHRSVLGDDQLAVYQDPDLRLGRITPEPATDVFGLGAVAYLLFTGQPPAATIAELDERLFALEELGLEYECALVEDGVFAATYGSPGPEVVDGDVRVIEPFAIFRHLVRREQGRLWPTPLGAQADADRWLDFQGRRLTAALREKNGKEIQRLLGFVEVQVAKGPWFMGEDFTIVDVVWSLLALPHSRAMLPVAKFPALSAYLDRVSARAAYQRGFERTLR